MIAIKEYRHTPCVILDLICNGCGAANAMFDFVPDTIWGMDISKACNRHDFEYWWHDSEAKRKEADDNFYSNLLWLIKSEGGWLRYPRRVRAWAYYRMVRYFGESAFVNKSITSNDRYREELRQLRIRYKTAMYAYFNQMTTLPKDSSVVEFMEADKMKRFIELLKA